MKILPTITTITPDQWREKVKEVKRFKLKEICLFPTCLNPEQRKELFSLLKETEVKSIPLVHLRSDMTIKELDYLIENYRTKIFNTHTRQEYTPVEDYGRYQKIVYIENTYEPFDEEEIKEFGGICLDFSHLENDRSFRPEIYKHDIEVIEKYPCGCSHISAAKNFPFLNKQARDPRYQHPHFLKNLSELDYLRKYPLKYFGDFSAIEIENTIEEQLKIKEYISTLIKTKEERNDSQSRH